MLAELFFQTAQQHSARTALVYHDRRWTWQEIAGKVLRVAAGLEHAGIGQSDRVALWLDNTPAFIISYFAVLARGAVVIPFNPASRPGDIALDGFDVPTVITSKRLEFGCRQALAAATDDNETSFSVCNDPDHCDDWNLLSDEPGKYVISEGEAPALLLFSSGSTGQPKALYRTHSQCIAEARHFETTCKTQSDDVIFCAIPLFHAHGMFNALWASVASGATLVLMRNPQPFTLHWERALDLLQTEGVTVFPGVPLFFDTLARAPAERHKKLKTVRLCFSAGSELPHEVYQRFKACYDISVRSLYGCTEAGSVSINLEDDADGSAHTVGRPMQGVKIEVRNTDGTAMPPGEDGEIAFSSAALTAAYLNADDVNRRCFNDGWYLSGDIGRLDSAGRLVVLGRKAFVIEVAGHKVYSPEIEALLCTYEGIMEAAVVGVEDKSSGQTIKAVVVTSGEPSAEEILDFCKARLPSYKCPKFLEIVPELPKTAMGKIAKTKL